MAIQGDHGHRLEARGRLWFSRARHPHRFTRHILCAAGPGKIEGPLHSGFHGVPHTKRGTRQAIAASRHQAEPGGTTRVGHFSQATSDTPSPQINLRRGGTSPDRTAPHAIAMSHQLEVPVGDRQRSHHRLAMTWVMAILVLVFSLAGCDSERDHLHQTTTSSSGVEAFGAAEAEFCTPAGTPEEQPHARHMSADEFVAGGSDTPKARIAPGQSVQAVVASPLPPSAFSFSTGPPTSSGGRDTLTRFCISRR